MESLPSNAQVHEYTLIRAILWALIVCAGFLSFSQNLSSDNKKARKLYEKADKKYKERDFQSAIDLLEEAASEDLSFFEAFVRMGSLYNAIGNEDSVYSKFQSYERVAPNPIASVLEKLAFLSFDRGEYVKSERYLSKFLEKVPERASSYEIDLLTKSLSFSRQQLLNPVDSLIIQPLPASVNQFKLQYLPSVTIEEGSIFFTKRDLFSGDEDIVVSHKKEGTWQPAISVSDRINSALNEGACTVSADGRTMIFTSCDGRKSVGSCDLYITKKIGDKWSSPKNLGRPVNSIYWESQPSLSADGKTLFFSSNRRGGYGGRDLWFSVNKNGKWSVPKNLGMEINSRKDETTPFIHPNGSQLYFSANGYPGMGGYDLYVVTKSDTSWMKPKNLGYPINTYKDEVSIIINAKGNKAYYAKEEQKNFEILDSKIVSVRLPDRLNSKSVSYLIGTVTDAKTNDPLNAKIQVVSLDKNESIYESNSDSVSGQYYMTLPIGQELAAYVKKKGYLFSEFTFSLDSNSLADPDTIDIKLVPIESGRKITLKNIYFEIDSYELNDKSESEIDNLVEVLRENPGLVVEIAGHTDDTGSANYNKELSLKRAKAVYDRIQEKGIMQEQITYKGYGDTQPLNLNTTEFYRKSNRRIEFRVIRTRQ